VFYLPVSLAFTQPPGGAALGAALVRSRPSRFMMRSADRHAVRGTVTLTIGNKPRFGTLAERSRRTRGRCGDIYRPVHRNGRRRGAILLATASPLSIESAAFDILNPATVLSAMDPIFKPVDSGALR
jgi:hypothetical protein